LFDIIPAKKITNIINKAKKSNGYRELIYLYILKLTKKKKGERK